MWHPSNLFSGHGAGILGAGHGADDCALLLAKYLLQLPCRAPVGRDEPSRTEKTVLVTGTTGRLGSHLLDLLESDHAVAKVVCLNRPNGDVLQRQILAASQSGIRLQLAKLEFLCADAGSARLGLDEGDYSRLLRQVDHIIHNAWPLNLQLPVTAFEPNIRAVRSLVDFAAASNKNVRITFVSSAATAARWVHKMPVPEAPISDMRVAATGYGQSKRVADILLQHAAEICGVPATVINVGQIAGSLRSGSASGGAWNRREWLPSLICSSVRLRALPSSLGPGDRIDWIPAEQAARVILELGNISGEGDAAPPASQYCVYNLINPKMSDWKTLVLSVRDYYHERGLKLKLVSLSDWASRVQRCPDSPVRNPAINFIDALKASILVKRARFQHAGFSSEKAELASPAMRETSPITADMMKHWCRQWNFEQSLIQETDSR